MNVNNASIYIAGLASLPANMEVNRVIIRRLGIEDCEALTALRIEALTNHPLAFGSSVPEDMNALREQFRARMSVDEDAAVLGAFDRAALVGMVGVRRVPDLKERHKAFVWGMYVAESHRKLGVGERLIRRAIEEARSWPGVIQLHLSVSEAAPEARRMYDRCGFREWGCEPRALCWHGRYVYEQHMVLDL